MKHTWNLFSISGFLAITIVFTLFSQINATAEPAPSTEESIPDLDTLIEQGEVNLNPSVTEVPPQTASGKDFTNPERIHVIGFDIHMAEPGISKDGNYMLFNDGPPHKDMHWSVRVSDTSYRYMGPVHELNKSQVDATPSFDLAGNLYFTSLVAYEKEYKSIYVCKFNKGKISDVKLVEGDIYIGEHMWFSLDPDISPDGSMLYYGEMQGQEGKPWPKQFNVRAAKRVGNRFVMDKNILKNVTTDDLEYAPCISADGKELFFTRTRAIEKLEANGIFVARRENINEPFGIPERINAITGPFVEAPTLSLDGKSLYYHKREGGTHVLYRVTR